jgi:hypothetical protein
MHLSKSYRLNKETLNRWQGFFCVGRGETVSFKRGVLFFYLGVHPVLFMYVFAMCEYMQRSSNKKVGESARAHIHGIYFYGYLLATIFVEVWVNHSTC